MHKPQFEALLIEDNSGDARLIHEMIKETGISSFHLTIKERLSGGIEFIHNAKVDILLLDLSLPDSIGLRTYTSVQEVFPALPIVILTSNDDQDLAYQAVKMGA
jgi:DNA-binding NarL/FixJ family response regulator